MNENLSVYVDSMEKTKQRDSISAVLSVCKLGNQLMQAETPWKKVKSTDEAEKARAAAVVGVCVNLSALVAVLVEPVMPNFSGTILKQLNVSLNQVRYTGRPHYDIIKDNQCKLLLVFQSPERFRCKQPTMLHLRSQAGPCDRRPR